MDALDDEYRTLLHIVSGRGRDNLIDCSATANNGQCQVTFADIKLDENGKPVPFESVITGGDDICTCQCLDYIFVINRNKDQCHERGSIN